ncbi:tripartite tricarboxylate transporter substrate binding protein [Pigmentiphaga soli]|uniref:Tripartite tricarboxylate transporter substrate binding protein n=1 Tax=Pigmentiphaga soli TaxID=1007095 RepID=A0ABP8HK98_9BURK
MIKRMTTLAASLMLAASFGAHAADTDYPTKPIHFIVATAAGGASDIVARIVADKMQQSLGQPVVVEPKAGANGNIAAEHVARSDPDGYTIMMGTIGVMAINPLIYKDVRFNPLRDFTPVARLVSFSNILVVNPQLPIHSVKELIDYAKKHPGDLHYGSPGVGGSPHMASLVFGQMAGIDIVHAPYKGAALALNDLMGGHIEMAFSDPLVTLPQIRAGKVRALAVSGEERLESEPSIPTVAEAGVPGYAVSGWLGIVAPTGTPPAIVAKLHKAANDALAMPEVRKKLVDLGAAIHPDTVENFGAYIKSENDRWKKVIADAKLELN